MQQAKTFTCQQCGKIFGLGSAYFDSRSMSPKYYKVNQATQKVEHAYCSPHCSLEWHQNNQGK